VEGLEVRTGGGGGGEGDSVIKIIYEIRAGLHVPPPPMIANVKPGNDQGGVEVKWMLTCEVRACLEASFTLSVALTSSSSLSLDSTASSSSCLERPPPHPSASDPDPTPPPSFSLSSLTSCSSVAILWMESVSSRALSSLCLRRARTSRLASPAILVAFGVCFSTEEITPPPPGSPSPQF